MHNGWLQAATLDKDGIQKCWEMLEKSNKFLQTFKAKKNFFYDFFFEVALNFDHSSYVADVNH